MLTIVVLHRFLQTAINFRSYWNAKLIMWRFRPKDFPSMHTWSLRGSRGIVQRGNGPMPVPEGIQRIFDSTGKR